MKNYITIEQYKKLEKLIDNWQEETHPEREYDQDFVTVMLAGLWGDSVADEKDAVFVTLTAYDWDGCTDFGTLAHFLELVGVELDVKSLESPHIVARELQEYGDDWQPVPHYDDGDASTLNGKQCHSYEYVLILSK